MSVVPLHRAEDPNEFGGKAFNLGAAIRAGLPVPPGYAISVAALGAVASDDATVVAQIHALLDDLGLPVAARSSAVGEDSEDASFAGQHLTALNLVTGDAVVDGLKRVHGSARSEAALAYRAKKGVLGEVRVAAVVQKLVDPVCAGVLFTRNPVTGAHEDVIEAAWGLGETVVAGLVTPDHYRVSREGRVVEARPGDKDLAVRRAPDGHTEEVEVEPDLIHARCLDDGWIARLVALARLCEAKLGADLDIEWARAGETLYLLQSRPISTRRK